MGTEILVESAESRETNSDKGFSCRTWTTKVKKKHNYGLFLHFYYCRSFFGDKKQ